jgi:hypothetical protein
MRLLLASLVMLTLQPGCIVVTTNSCGDGFQNGTETDIDCGGACAACGNGASCGIGADCASGSCIGGICGLPVTGCNNGVRDGLETDIDCGGGVCAACSNGKLCIAPQDCLSGMCLTGTVPRVCGGAPPPCVLPTVAAQTTAYPLYKIVPNGTATLAPGDVGFIVTANTSGGYRVAWTDETGGQYCMTGIIRGNGGLDTNQTIKLSGMETVSANAQEVRFASKPGTRIDGIDVVTLGDPMYLDAYINGTLTNVRIYYRQAPSNQVTTAIENPASFSP